MAERNLVALAPLNTHEGCSEILGMPMSNNCGSLALRALLVFNSFKLHLSTLIFIIIINTNNIISNSIKTFLSFQGFTPNNI